MCTFQGTFHASPDYALWYGWSEMRRDLTEIKELPAEMVAIAEAFTSSLPTSDLVFSWHGRVRWEYPWSAAEES